MALTPSRTETTLSAIMGGVFLILFVVSLPLGTEWHPIWAFFWGLMVGVAIRPLWYQVFAIPRKKATGSDPAPDEQNDA
jgi:hypothetical protein